MTLTFEVWIPVGHCA